MTCLLSLPDNEMCGVWIYGVLYINNIVPFTSYLFFYIKLC